MLLLDRVSELEHVNKVLEAYFVLKNDFRLPDQVRQSLVVGHYIDSAHDLCEFVCGQIYPLLVSFDVLKQLSEVVIHALLVPLQLVMDQLFVVEEDLGQQKITEDKDADQQEGPEVQHAQSVFAEVRGLHIWIVRHSEQDEHRVHRLIQRDERGRYLAVGEQDEADDDVDDEIGEDNDEHGHRLYHHLGELYPNLTNRPDEKQDQEHVENVHDWSGRSTVVCPYPNQVTSTYQHEGTHADCAENGSLVPHFDEQAHDDE